MCVCCVLRERVVRRVVETGVQEHGQSAEGGDDDKQPEEEPVHHEGDELPVSCHLEGTHTEVLTVSTDSAMYCMYAMTHEHHRGMFGTLCAQELQTEEQAGRQRASCCAHFSPCRPCPASSAARPCMSRQRWLTSGWEGGSDKSCQCSGAAGAARCSHTLNKEDGEQWKKGIETVTLAAI